MAIVGTANIDRLSLRFKYETNLEIHDEGFAADMEKYSRPTGTTPRKSNSTNRANLGCTTHTLVHVGEVVRCWRRRG
jgi:hypothetical protein